jgi:hypothetical protein
MSFSAHTRLRRPVGHLVHKREGHGEVLCEENGVAAPMMPSILLMGGWQELDDWIDAALARRSLPLLSRIRIALLRVEGLPTGWPGMPVTYPASHSAA